MLPLDLHAHIDPRITSIELDGLNACVVAVTRTADEFAAVLSRRDQSTVWGLGAHPGISSAHEDFNTESFRKLLHESPVVGEIGLDGRSDVTLAVQTRTFDAILAILRDHPRLTSVHSVAATAAVLEVIQSHRPKGLVLHWWRGSKVETNRALDLGCYFSINAAEVFQPRILSLLPPERILTETDHPFGDRREAKPRRPGHVDTVEACLSRHWDLNVEEVRRRVWANLLQIATETATIESLPAAFQSAFLTV